MSFRSVYHFLLRREVSDCLTILNVVVQFKTIKLLLIIISECVPLFNYR